MYRLNKDEQVVLIKEIDTGASVSESSVQEMDAEICHHSDKKIRSHSKMNILNSSNKGQQIDIDGCSVVVRTIHLGDQLVGKFNFLSSPDNTNDEVFYITVKDGNQIVKYLSGRTEFIRASDRSIAL